jgi:2-desacetyl-2-hydroxyethyl bacteriochlorophyllide A dehydrogenase
MLKYIEFEGANRASMQETSLPLLSADQTMIRATLSGISSGTERMWLEGSASALRSGRRSYPYRPGYALVGKVVAVGAEFEGLSIDDRVFAMKPHASHAVVTSDDVWFRLPDHVDEEDAVAVSLGATAIHAIHRSGITIGDGVAVAGLGVLGMIMLQVLSATIGGPIVALTRTPAKRALALANGATRVFTYDEFQREQASLPPLQAVFECSGAAANISELLTIPRPQGVVVLAGFYNDPIALDGETLFRRELTVVGVRAAGSDHDDNEYNRWDRRRNVAFASALLAAGKIKGRHLVTHRFPAERHRDAYDLILGGADQPVNPLQVCLSWR